MTNVIIPVRYDSKELKKLLKDLTNYQVSYIEHVNEKVARVLKIMYSGNSQFTHGSEEWLQACEFFKENPPQLHVYVPNGKLDEFNEIMEKYKYTKIAYVLEKD